MESIACTHDRLYARDQWGRVWFYGPVMTPDGPGAWEWQLMPPPPGSVWYEVSEAALMHQPGSL
jgi:hypothetical protein